jgi:DNA repair exonuclease SbcCD ATPase subunit
MTTINQAQKLMDQRKIMIAEATEILAILGATQEEMQHKEQVINITINKGQIVAVETTKEIVKEVSNDEELNRLYEENARHIRRINELAAHNEELVEDGMKLENEVCYLQGQILGYKNTIAKLEERIEELKTAIPNAVKLEVTKGETEEAITKGGDSMALPINIPDEYLDDPEMIEAIRSWTAEYNKPFEDKVVFGKPYSAEAQKNQVVKKANSVLVNLMKQIDARRSTNLTYETIKAANGITGAFGEITLNNKKYAFKYDATFEYPTVFGAMSMDIIAQAKAVLDKTINFDRDETQLGQKHKYETIYDFDNNIVVWVADDGCFKGYTDKHAFVWDPSHAMPIGTPVASALKNKWKKMNASWGKNFPALAAFIMDYCRQIDNKTNDEIDLEDTNEIIIDTHKNTTVVNTTAVENTEDIVTAWDDIDI